MNDKAEARFREAFVALHLGQFERAARLLQALLRKTPRHFDALIALGAVYGEQGRFREAVALLERATKVRPDNAEAHYNLGVALAHIGERDRALECYRSALRAEPQHLNACNNLAAELLALSRPDEALIHIQQGIAAHPGDAQLVSKLAVALKDTGRIDEAVDAFQQIARAHPNDPINHGNLGLALRDAGRFDDARRSFERAVSLAPRDASHHNHLGLSLSDCARLDDAITSLRRAVEIEPSSAEFRENLGITLLLKGDLDAGWPQYEYRYRLERFKSRHTGTDAPAWQGEPLAEKSILAYSEQGFGDTIQFVRYVPLLARMAASVVLAVQPRLVPLLSALPGPTAVIPADNVHEPFDFQCALLSLPQRFSTTLANIPADVPYLSADEGLAARWRDRLGKAGFKIGISWQGNPDYLGDRSRSIPLQQFAPLAAIPGVRLISLQQGHGTEQIASVDFPIEILDEDFDRTGAFVDSAALMTTLDFVVSSDTAIPHLAGALARPVFIALARIPDWRWLVERDDCPWYPTARLFRQRSPGDWADVFARIAEDVRAVALARTP